MWLSSKRFLAGGATLLVVLSAATTPLAAQMRTIDPNQAIDSDLPGRSTGSAPSAASPPPYTAAPIQPDVQRYPDPPQSAPPQSAASDATAVPTSADQTAQTVARDKADAVSAESQTFQQQELLRAAEGTFGKGASGLAGILERTLKEQGSPNAYIAGREASGAVVVGLRYGNGTLFHKVEGQQPIYWTGPSVGFDLGGDANKVFVLVYNVYDTEQLFRRFPAAEGRLYVVGGFTASYLRRDNMVIIPIRLGVGWRQGVNIGYMKFSHKSKVLPF